MKISVSFTPIIADAGLQGFASIKIDDWLVLGSVGVYSRLNGPGFRLTWPAKKLPNGLLKHYFKITDAKIEEEIRVAVEKEIERLKVYQVRSATDEKF